MSGRTSLLLAGVVFIAGAALAAPAPFLAVGGTSVPLVDDAFVYEYRQSVYDVPVREEFRVAGDLLRIVRAASDDVRALEYFRWPGEPSAVPSGGFAQEAPADRTASSLVIRVADQRDQAIRSGERRIALAAIGGPGAVVEVRAASRPLALWLLGRIMR